MFLIYTGIVQSQYESEFSGEYENRPQDKAQQSDGSLRESRLPNPGDSDYRTYVYNNRRYGTDPTRYNPYHPTVNQPGGFPYNPLPYNPLNTNPLDDQYKYNTVSIIFN